MSLTFIKLLSALLILSITIIAAWYPFQRRVTSTCSHDFPIGEALASGVFLGAGLIHMLGDASQDFVQLHIHYPWPFLLAGVTFLCLLWLEHLGREFYEHRGASSPAFAVIAVVMLSFHSLLAGAALGLSANLSVFIVILIAILAHKWAASFALAVQVNKTTLSLKARLIYFAIFALMAPVGVLIGNGVVQDFNVHPLLEPVFSALAAGTFLYLGTLHGLRQAVMVERCCNLKHFSYVIAGFALMAIVAIWT